MLEIVKDYTDDGIGDFVRCVDCGELQVIQIGGTCCGRCESENLQWEDEDNQEVDTDYLDSQGYIIE